MQNGKNICLKRKEFFLTFFSLYFSVERAFQQKKLWTDTTKHTLANDHIRVNTVTRALFRQHSCDHIYSIILVKMDFHVIPAAANSIERAAWKAISSRCIWKKMSQKRSKVTRTAPDLYSFYEKVNCLPYFKIEFQCTACEKQYSTKSALLVHQKTHYERELKCHICDKRFKAITSFEKHMESKHAE